MADGFLALPGGFGTLDELFEILTWAQLGLHHKPVGLLNVAGFWDGLMAFLAHGCGEGLIAESNLEMLQIHEDPERSVDMLLCAIQMRPPLR